MSQFHPENSRQFGSQLAPGYLATTAIVLATLIIQAVPGMDDHFEWKRWGTLVAGLSSHLTHWSWDHLVWDLAAFVILAVTALKLQTGRYLLCLGFSAILIPLEIGLFQTHLDSYRGLSGIDSALFGLIITALWKLPPKSGKFPASKILAVSAGLSFLAKTLFELSTGNTVFVSSQTIESSSTFIPAVSAHLTGAITGILAGAVPGYHQLRDAFSAGSISDPTTRNS